MFQRILAAAGSEPLAVQYAAERLKFLDPCARVDTFHLDPARPGDVLDDLLERSVEIRADILVVGARRHVIASRAAMLAPCSVLMVPSDAKLDFKHILVPVDFSDSSADALREGARLAAVASGSLRALTVECNDEPWLEWKRDPSVLQNRLNEFANGAAGRRLSEDQLVEPVIRSATALHDGGISLPHNIEGADIASTILSVASRENASLIVMGTRGRTRSASMLLGSVTEHVIQHSPIPVLAVKRSGHQLGLVQAVLDRLRAPEPEMAVN